jgi:hypothetical protein
MRGRGIMSRRSMRRIITHEEGLDYEGRDMISRYYPRQKLGIQMSVRVSNPAGYLDPTSVHRHCLVAQSAKFETGNRRLLDLRQYMLSFEGTTHKNFFNFPELLRGIVTWSLQNSA